MLSGAKPPPPCFSACSTLPVSHLTGELADSLKNPEKERGAIWTQTGATCLTARELPQKQLVLSK